MLIINKTIRKYRCKICGHEYLKANPKATKTFFEQNNHLCNGNLIKIETQIKKELTGRAEHLYIINKHIFYCNSSDIEKIYNIVCKGVR